MGRRDMMKQMMVAFFAIGLIGCGGKQDSAIETPTESNLVEPAKEEIVATDTEASTQVVYGQGYAIEYPTEWELKPKYMGTDSMAISPLEGQTDAIRENVNVVFESTSVATTPRAYFEANLPTMKQHLQKFTQLTNQPVLLTTGVNAHELMYTHEYNGQVFQVRAIFLAKGSVGYVITCTALPETYAQHAGQFDSIVNSFRFDSAP